MYCNNCNTHDFFGIVVHEDICTTIPKCPECRKPVRYKEWA